MDTTEPAWNDGQLGLVMACDDDTLTAEEAWNLINQKNLDDDELRTRGNDVDGSKQAYRCISVVDNDVEPQDHQLNHEPQVEYTQKVFLHDLYQALRTKCDTLEQAEGCYEAVWFCNLGVVDSSIYSIMYDNNSTLINKQLTKHDFQIMFVSTLQII